MTGSAVLVVGFEAWENLRLSTRRPWVQKYRWPIHFFVSVAFWNLVGAGLFGFMINPPIALYYMQGLNTTRCMGTPHCSASTGCWASA
jgi:nitric oxide reductase subunit B